MATDIATSQAHGVVNHAMGSFTGDGTDTTISVGFTPRKVRLVNVTDRIVDEKYEGMNAADVVHMTAAGASTLDTSGLITFASPEADGFRGFTVDAAAAISAKVLVWEAFG